MGAVALCYSFLLVNLYQIQVTNGAYYAEKAGARSALSGFLDPERGTIYFTDKNGTQFAAAINKDFPIVYAVPRAVQDPEAAADALAPLLGIERESILKKLLKQNSKYELLAERVSEGVASQVDALKMKGVYADTARKRFYPFGALAAHLLGFVGPNEKDSGASGHYGLEKFYETELSGVSGKIKGNKTIPSVPGEDIALTIDLNIQTEAERILYGLVQKYKAAGGGVIAADPRTGKILAMASRPNFDPNRYSEANLRDFINPMTQELYEPGSVVKALTMASGIDAGKIEPGTTYVDKGFVVLNGKTIRNADFAKRGGYGKITMTNVLEHSLNTGAVFVQRELGRELFQQYFSDFGLSERTGIDVGGEVEGNLHQLNPKERDIAFATAAYGQGIAITPIELLSAVGAIANGGELMRPYVNAAFSPEVIRKVVSEDAARKTAQMMVSAVDKAEIAKVSGYAIAGKTGTAYVPDFKKGGYTENVINTYVGFAPASDPRFIILVKLDNPAGAPLAGLSVVPAFRDLAQFMLNYYNIPPDRLEKSS
ncbi:MAG: penicillin-binding protein 2 [Patescibacteria group bacterium]